MYQRSEILRMVEQGRDYQEIGAELGISPQAVDGLLKRARQFLKKALQDYLD